MGVVYGVWSERMMMWWEGGRARVGASSECEGSRGSVRRGDRRSRHKCSCQSRTQPKAKGDRQKLLETLVVVEKSALLAIWEGRRAVEWMDDQEASTRSEVTDPAKDPPSGGPKTSRLHNDNRVDVLKMNLVGVVSACEPETGRW